MLMEDLNLILGNDNKLAASCEMEDLQIQSQEIVSSRFQVFLENTAEIVETRDILDKFAQNLRLKFDNWPTSQEAIQLFQANLQNAKKRSVKWSDSDKRLFYWIVIRYYIYKDIVDNRQLTKQEWRDIAALVSGRNAHQCRLKWEQKYKISLSEAPWTMEEDQLLQDVHAEFTKLGKENKWSQLAREIYKRSPAKIFRQPKQCRERWINKLDPNISNDPWSKQQEIELLKTILIRGKKWSELSALYNRVRTENSLKNKFNSLLKKEKQKYEFETINPQLFRKVQKLRMDYSMKFGKITPIEEIDNYEWQFIVLAIQSLQIELYIQLGKFQEAQRIKNEGIFNLFAEDPQIQGVKEILYKKNLTIQQYTQQIKVENDHSGVVIYNPKTKKIFITPYNSSEFQNHILNHLQRPIKVEEQLKSSTISASDHNMLLQRSILSQDDINRQSLPSLILFAHHPTNGQPYMLPMGNSMMNSYWMPQPVPPQQMSQSMGQINLQQQQQKPPEKPTQPQKPAATIDDLFGGNDIQIKVVDSDQE